MKVTDANTEKADASPFDLHLARSGDDFAVMGMHFKLGLYEHQSAGAIQAMTDLLANAPELMDNGGHGRHGHLNNPVAPEAMVDREEGAIDSYSAGGAEVDIGMGKAAACGLTEVPAMVITDGKRCEPYRVTGLSTSRPGKKENQCACEAIADKITGEHRRLITTSVVRPARTKSTTKTGLAISASIVGKPNQPDLWLFPTCRLYGSLGNCSDVSHCFVDRTAPVPKRTLSISMIFDSVGTARSVAIADMSGTLSRRETECVKARAMTAQAACPAEQSVSVSANLWLSVE